MHTCYQFAWIKVLNYTQIETIEYMSAMGSSSENLLIYVTSSLNPYIPIILTAKKLDGSIVLSFEINDPVIG